ncbi:MAG: HDOD domain-containing protein, partial [bacterium]|nr:HDOD domain-containing protein [bacterium]
MLSIDEKTHERLLSILDGNVQLPALPSRSAQLMHLLRQPLDAIDVRRVVALVEQDQTLTARLLRLANSPAYGGSRNITRLHQAVMAIGLVETIEVVNYLVMRKLMPRIQPR